jgi:Ca2+-binding RTX toxin-like protein
LQGLAGNDVLNGLLGHDQFWFNNAGPTHADVIDFGYLGEVDTIVLQAVFFTALNGSVGGALDAANFVLGATAVDPDDYLLYDAGNLWYDADGSLGVSSAQLIATLTGAPTLASSDFLIVA